MELVNGLVGGDTLIGTRTPELTIIDLYSVHLWVTEACHMSGTCSTVDGKGKKERLAIKRWREGGREGSRERG